MTKYIALENIPGYMPALDDAPTFDTAAEAWWYHYHERCTAESSAEICEICDERNDNGNHGVTGWCDDDSETAEALSKAAQDGTTAGVIYGPTPDYTGDHDLGIAYSVATVEED